MPTRTLLAGALAAAALLLTAACGQTVHNTVGTNNPKVGITTHATVTADDTVVQVNNWWNGGGKAKLSAVTADLGKLGHDGTNVSAVNADCGSLSNDVDIAQMYAPIPDPQAQQHWSAALIDFSQAATNCQAGATTLDTSLIDQAGAQMKAGTAEFNAVTARVTQIAASS